MLFTLDLYEQRGWQTYGGGANRADAAEPAKFEHNGNRIAFLGCNGKPPGYATASDTSPGALHCDMDDMARRVRALKAEGYLPIFTFQHLEYYQYVAHPLLQVDFQKIAEAGAVIVSGSQAHQPHAFEIRDGAFLHYGLGNLFFDQTNQGDPPRTAFIDRHVIYNGRHISTELLTIYFEDWARARPMTADERAELLQTVFEASEW
jgi:poly-gamma-glutamate synthesis protein (capsule biosynthesis protein)